MDYFTADLHLSHENIIGYCARPFANAKKMNATIIRRFNEVLTEGDTLYILGDLSTWYNVQPEEIGKLVRRIKGRKILILGNHDKFNVFDYIDMGIESAHTHFFHEGLRVHLVHDPSVASGPASMLWLCGHVHGLFKEVRNVLNVGVDVWDFRPVSETEVREWIAGKELR